jgi:hypothetical protein
MGHLGVFGLTLLAALLALLTHPFWAFAAGPKGLA